MRFLRVAFILLAAKFTIGGAPSLFVGKWQTRVSSVTHKSTITVNIVEKEQTLSGTVVLVNPDANEMQLPFANVKVMQNVIEFETHDNNSAFYWRLAVQNNRTRGLLHGSCREMLIDEWVRKRH
jgi:hypothetical protein